MAGHAMPNKFLSISIYSGFILCLFRYKSGIPILTVTHYHTVHVVFMQKEPYNNTYCHTVNVVLHRNSLHTQDTDATTTHLKVCHIFHIGTQYTQTDTDTDTDGDTDDTDDTEV